MPQIETCETPEADQLLRLVRAKVEQFLGRSPRLADARDDLVQRSLLRVLMRPGQLDLDRPGASTYVGRIVESTFIDGRRRELAEARALHARAVAAGRSVSNGGPGEHSRETGSSQDGRSVRRARHLRDKADLAMDLDSVIDELPPDKRRLFHRLKVETAAEAAAAEGVCRGTIYRRMRAVRQQFEDAGLRIYLDETP